MGSLTRWKVVALPGMAGALRRQAVFPRSPPASACEWPFLSPRPHAGRVGSGHEHASASWATWPSLHALTLSLPCFTTGSGLGSCLSAHQASTPLAFRQVHASQLPRLPMAGPEESPPSRSRSSRLACVAPPLPPRLSPLPPHIFPISPPYLLWHHFSPTSFVKVLSNSYLEFHFVLLAPLKL